MLDAFDAEWKSLPHRQLVAVNPANLYAKVETVHPAVDYLKFHCCTLPAAAPMNDHWKRPLGFDETLGNKGTLAFERRTEASAWMFSGGARTMESPKFTADLALRLSRVPRGR